jgi:hypothetical protein
MKCFITNPPRLLIVEPTVKSRLESDEHIVLESAFFPFATHNHSIVDECLFMSAPHYGRWMIDPTACLATKRIEDLPSLNSLFTYTLII